jgi:hypothetical protein
MKLDELVVTQFWEGMPNVVGVIDLFAYFNYP